MKLGIFLTLCTCIISTYAVDFEIINQWNLLNYDFPFDYDIRNFRPENTVFTGLEVTDDKIFLAMPRLRAGVPATLATIPRHTPPGSSPLLRPYPDWSYHEVGRTNQTIDCGGLISVYRMRKDSCNRIWILDSGIMTSIDDFTRICPPKILIFDLLTDRLIRSIIFPRQVLRPASLFTNIIIDESIQGTCDSAFAYISDTAAPGIVVYDSIKDQAWRFMHPTMFPDPDFSDYNVGNERFTLMDGVVGLAHSPKLGVLFYQPLATDRIFTISTSFLTRGPPAEGEDLPVSLAGKKSSQGLGLALNPVDDTLYFSPLAETSVASWNPISNQQNLVAYDPRALQFPAELRWIAEDNSLWLLTTRFQKYFRRTVSPNEINLRIIRIPAGSSIYSSYSSNNLYYK